MMSTKLTSHLPTELTKHYSEAFLRLLLVSLDWMQQMTSDWIEILTDGGDDDDHDDDCFVREEGN